MQAVQYAIDEVDEVSTSTKPRLIMATDGSFKGNRHGGSGASAVVWSNGWMPSETESSHDAAGHQADGHRSSASCKNSIGEEAVAFSNIRGSILAEKCALSLAFHMMDREIREKLSSGKLKPGAALQVVVISDCASPLRQLSTGIVVKESPEALISFIIQQSHNVVDSSMQHRVHTSIRLMFCPRSRYQQLLFLRRAEAVVSTPGSCRAKQEIGAKRSALQMGTISKLGQDIQPGGIMFTPALRT